MMAVCGLCAAIAELVQHPPSSPEEERYLWEYDQLQQNQDCLTCQKLSKHLGKTQRLSSNTGFKCYLRYRSFTLFSVWTLRLKQSDLDRLGHYEWLAKIGSVSDAINGVGVAVNSQAIDLSRIQAWVKNCDDNHLGVCHSIADPWQTIKLTTLLLFIDVESRCLTRKPVKVDTNTRYAALSYVWGTSINPLQTTMENLDQLCQKGAFDTLCSSSLVPKTIEHCVLLTRALGIRYLWVDRFCIVQDDNIGKANQIAAMAAIYANSYITIAATEGANGDFGLPGLFSGYPRRQPFEEFDFGSGCRMFDPEANAIYGRAYPSRYHSRAWTLQEWGLSHRVLLFHGQTVSWLCHKHEEQENGYPLLAIRSMHSSHQFWTRCPDIHSFLAIISTYSIRDLSDPEDVLAALAAIITVQGRAMVGGVFYGVPELFFGPVLLWEPVNQPKRRRTNKNGEISNKFPSWSWIGWLGPVRTDRSNILLSPTDHMQYGQTYTHLVDFYKVPVGPKSRSREVIRESHSYEMDTEEQQSLMEQFPEMKKELQRTPVAEHPEAVALHTESLYSTIIECRTQRARYYLNASLTIPSNLGPRIVDASGSVVGVLHGSSSAFQENLPEEPAEFIRISAMDFEPVNGTSHDYVPLWKILHQNCPKRCHRDVSICSVKQHWHLKVYNVLWIEWEDGVVFRKHVGVILRDAWDTGKAEEVDVRLG
jgi:hypothetical protein